MRQVNVLALSGADTGSVNGSQIDSNQLVSASFQIVFGDVTAVGTFKLQMSNDVAPNAVGPNTFTVTNWTDIPNQTAAITAGASAVLTISQTSYRWLRAVYTRSSGGSTTAIVNMFALSV